MAHEAQGFGIPLASPARQFFLLTGILPPQTGFGTDGLERYTAQYNLSQMQSSVLPSALDPNKTSVTAAVSLASINNDDDFDSWTWAVDEVTHEINDKGELLLNVAIAGQGGGPTGKETCILGVCTPGIIYVGDVIGNLTYNVIVLTRE